MKSLLLFIFIFTLLISCAKIEEIEGIEEEVVEKIYVYLTFDDGPNSIYTPQILDILSELDIKATFFVVGHEVRKRPEIIIRMLNEGHSIQNHSYSHSNIMGISNDSLLMEIKLTENLLKDLGVTATKYFRPPWGIIGDQQTAFLNESGYNVSIWDIDSHDWDPEYKNSKMSIQHFVFQAKNQDVLLFHDGGGNRSYTVNVLNSVIGNMIENNYHFLTLE